MRGRSHGVQSCIPPCVGLQNPREGRKGTVCGRDVARVRCGREQTVCCRCTVTTMATTRIKELRVQPRTCQLIIHPPVGSALTFALAVQERGNHDGAIRVGRAVFPIVYKGHTGQMSTQICRTTWTWTEKVFLNTPQKPKLFTNFLFCLIGDRLTQRVDLSAYVLLQWRHPKFRIHSL